MKHQRIWMRFKPLACLGAVVLGSGLAAPGSAQAQGPRSFEIGLEVFYDELAPYGEWVRVDEYGWVWAPADIPFGWRPYTHGRWVYAHDYGWTWVSDFEWGWACFHYGRWDFHPRYGWIWIPDTEWAPAWVAWRAGDGYVGWAPLPPRARWRADIGLDFGGIDIDVSLEPAAWSFVEERMLFEPRIDRYVVLPARNVTFVRRTRNVTRYVSVGGRISNVGCDVGRIESVTGRRFHRVRLRDTDSVLVVRNVRMVGEDVPVYRPRVRKAAVDPGPRVFQGGKYYAPSGRGRRHDASYLRRLESEQQDQRDALRRAHERELRSGTRTIDVSELRRRQAEEAREMERLQRRQKTIIEDRVRRLDDDSPKRIERGPDRESDRGSQRSPSSRTQKARPDRP